VEPESISVHMLLRFAEAMLTYRAEGLCNKMVFSLTNSYRANLDKEDTLFSTGVSMGQGTSWRVLWFLIRNWLLIHDCCLHLQLPGWAVICEMLVRAANHAETVVLAALLLCWEELAVRSEDLGKVRIPGGSQHPSWSLGL